jgi:hypothetical protein
MTVFWVLISSMMITDMLEEYTALMLGDGTFRHARKKHNFVST